MNVDVVVDVCSWPPSCATTHSIDLFFMCVIHLEVKIKLVLFCGLVDLLFVLTFGLWSTDLDLDRNIFGASRCSASTFRALCKNSPKVLGKERKKRGHEAVESVLLCCG